MQSFLPHQSFFQSASVLDNKRLPKQLMECVDIYRILAEGHLPKYRNHPAVKQWKHHIGSLLSYGNICYIVWQQRFDFGTRGGKRDHKSGKFIRQKYLEFIQNDRVVDPPWLGNELFHSSHRACLLGKKPEWYSQFNWDENPAVMIDGSWPYWWPTRNGY